MLGVSETLHMMRPRQIGAKVMMGAGLGALVPGRPVGKLIPATERNSG